MSGPILLTGASGFVGGALLPALCANGGVRCLVRDARRLPAGAAGEAVEADLSEPSSLTRALGGIEQAYYLVHSMEEAAAGGGFADRDRSAAQNFAAAARDAGVRRVIYLGGVGGHDGTSEHLDSRREIERILTAAAPELVVIRASMIVGAGSASFETLVRIVDRLPVLALPSWRDRRTQPVAIEDVVAALVAARDVAAGIYEIGGPDTLTFEAMTRVIAELLGDEHRAFPLPFSHARLEGAAAALVTGQERELLEPLMAGMHGDLTIERNALPGVFGIEPEPFREAARRAMHAMRGIVATG